jgi:hypothetical protein
VIFCGWTVPGDVYALVETGSDIRGLPIIEETRFFFWKGKVGGAGAFSPTSRMIELPVDEDDKSRESTGTTP